MNDIVKTINDRISEGIRCLIGDISINAFGIAKPVNIEDDENMSIPAVVAKSGECFYVFTDDESGLGWYHRLVSRNYSKGKGFGDYNADIQTDEIYLVVWGLSNIVGMQAEEIESKIIVPAIPQKAELISSNFDTKAVLSNEFKNFDYLNKPEEFVFSVKYKVSTVFKRKCREIKCN